MSSDCNNPNFPMKFKDEICFKDEPLEDSVEGTVFNESSIYSTRQEHTVKCEDAVLVSACTRFKKRSHSVAANQTSLCD